MTVTVRVKSIGVALSLVILGTSLAADARQASPQRRPSQSRRVEGYYKGRITPHWFDENRRFWYRNDLSGGVKEFIRIDAEQGTRGPAFDHARLAAALSEASRTEYQADRLPFDIIEFVDDGKAILFNAADRTWKCDLGTCAVSPSDATISTTEETPAFGTRGRRSQRGGQMGRRRDPSPESPDGKWTASIQDYNVFVRSQDPNQEVRLSTDGVENNAYDLLSWSPDSSVLVAWRIEPGDRKEVHLVQSSPPGGGRAVLRTRPYALPGDKFPFYELNLFDVAAGKQVKPNIERFEHEWERPQVHWSRDGSFFTYQQEDRGHQRLRVVKVDTRSGAVSHGSAHRTRQGIGYRNIGQNLFDRPGILILCEWIKRTVKVVLCCNDG